MWTTEGLGWLRLRVGSHLALSLHSTYEPGMITMATVTMA